MGTSKNDNNAWVPEILQPPKIVVKHAKKIMTISLKKFLKDFLCY